MAKIKTNIGKVIEKVKKLKRKKIKRERSKVQLIEKELWTFNLDPNSYPIIVCINRKSGGLSGEKVLKSFYRYLNPIQVNYFRNILRSLI